MVKIKTLTIVTLEESINQKFCEGGKYEYKIIGHFLLFTLKEYVKL